MPSARKVPVGEVLSVKPGCKASGGEIRSENVDMSSDKQGERPCRRKSKGSCLKQSEQGKPAPKARQKCVVDGNHVNIRGPGGSDGSQRLFALIGLGEPFRGPWK